MIVYMALAFIIGYFAGVIVNTVLSEKIEESNYYGINPNELISWLENYQYNYEYLAPPTTGEIIAKIRKMAENLDDENY